MTQSKLNACKMCGKISKIKGKYYTVCNHCHKTIQNHTQTPSKNYLSKYYNTWTNYKSPAFHDKYCFSRVIEKYKPKLSNIIYDSMKNFKEGQIVKYKKVARFRDMPFTTKDDRVLSTFINKIGEIRRIGKLIETRNSLKFIEVRFILPNMKKKDILCVRRELTDATNEEKEQYVKIKEQFDAMEVARQI